MRTWVLIVVVLTAIVTDSRAAYSWGNEYFTEPHSIMLFGGNLLVVTSTGNFTVPKPPGWIGQYASPLPALSPVGDQLAWSLKLPIDPANSKCSPFPYKMCPGLGLSAYKSVMGVYSLRDKAWKFYGDFCLVGSAAYSPDGTRIAFMGKERLGNPDCGYVYGSDLLHILDLQSGLLTPVPETGGMPYIDQLSWAPDGKRLAIGLKNSIVSIEIGSWAQKVITEGTNPSWSPKGDWIAYNVHDGRTCMLIRPDGTGAKIVFDLRPQSGGWLFYDGETWSPDGEKLLLNEEVMDGVDFNVTMLDLVTGKTTTRSKKGLPVLGWVAAIK